MSRVVIVARTRMYRDHVCVGGHDLDRGFRGLRLLDRHGNHFTSESPFGVGEVWEMYYREKGDNRPHVEDVAVKDHRLIRQVEDLRGLVLQHARPWSGGPETLFDGTLRSTRSGACYIPSKGPLPGRSTGFWVPDHELERLPNPPDRPDARGRFQWTGQGGVRRITWVGLQEAPERIEAGALVRVSLSRLFGSETAPDGYYLQISGVL